MPESEIKALRWSILRTWRQPLQNYLGWGARDVTRPKDTEESDEFRHNLNLPNRLSPSSHDLVGLASKQARETSLKYYAQPGSHGHSLQLRRKLNSSGTAVAIPLSPYFSTIQNKYWGAGLYATPEVVFVTHQLRTITPRCAPYIKGYAKSKQAQKKKILMSFCLSSPYFVFPKLVLAIDMLKLRNPSVARNIRKHPQFP